jgi:hypothetical protein
MSSLKFNDELKLEVIIKLRNLYKIYRTKIKTTSYDEVRLSKEIIKINNIISESLIKLNANQEELSMINFISLAKDIKLIIDNSS